MGQASPTHLPPLPEVSPLVQGDHRCRRTVAMGAVSGVLDEIAHVDGLAAKEQAPQPTQPAPLGVEEEIDEWKLAGLPPPCPLVSPREQGEVPPKVGPPFV